MKKLLIAVLLLATAVVFSQTVIRQNDTTFVYQCVTTAGTDYNYIGLPLQTKWTMANQLDPTAYRMNSISRWNSYSQSWWTTYYSTVIHSWVNTFVVERGYGLMINAKINFDFTVNGYNLPYQYYLNTTSGMDYNLIVHPVVKEALTTSSMIGNDIGTQYCNAISKWNATTQAFQTSSYLLTQWMNTFSTSAGQPLFVNMKADCSWPAEKMNESEINEYIVQGASEYNISKGSKGLPRALIFHYQDRNGDELDFPEEASQFTFKAWIMARPTEILTQDSYDCGFIDMAGYSAIQVNIGNLPTAWAPGDVLNIQTYPTNYMYPDSYTYALDNSGDPVFLGFEPIIPESGTSCRLNITHLTALASPPVTTIEGDILTLSWTAASGATGYNVYSSDEPYGTFSFVTSVTTTSWQISATENKKFYYITTTNANKSKAEETITVKEKK